MEPDWRRLLPLFLILFLSSPAAAVEKPASDELIFSQPFQRVISLYPGHTENICSLGGRDQLVAIASSDDYPPEILAMPRLSHRDDPEKFLALRPDLVLIRPMIGRAVPQLVDKLRQAGIRVISLQPKGVEELFDYWRTLGRLLGRQQQAEAMVEQFASRLKAVQARLQLTPPDARPRVYFQSIHQKMKTFSPHSIAIFVLEQAGGVNAAADALTVRETNIAEYGKERLLSQGERIDIFLAQQGRMNPVSHQQISEEPGFQGVRAVREGRIHLIAEPLVSRPTLRILDGIEQLNALLHPLGKDHGEPK